VSSCRHGYCFTAHVCAVRTNQVTAPDRAPRKRFIFKLRANGRNEEDPPILDLMGRKELLVGRPVSRDFKLFSLRSPSATRQSQVSLNRFLRIKLLRLTVLRPRLAVGFAFIGAIANVKRTGRKRKVSISDDLRRVSRNYYFLLAECPIPKEFASNPCRTIEVVRQHKLLVKYLQSGCN
jgi:hypothetical protein